MSPRSACLLAPVLLLLGCSDGCDGENPPDLKVTAKQWAAADALFHREPRWLGGDAAFSVDLGKGRTLWLFGDSFIATSPANQRSESRMVRNSVAIQAGTDPTTASISFHWRAGDEPGSFFPEDGEAWFWPGHGVRLDQGLLLFLARVVKDPDPGSLGFRAAGWEARWVENPDEAPASWTIKKVSAPGTSFALVGGIGLLREGGFLYAYAVREPDSHDVVLLRWDEARAAKSDLSTPSWWLGKERGWGEGRPAVLFSGATEFSVHREPDLGRYLYVQTQGFGAADLVLRTAPRPEGPWSSARKVFRPPESDRGGKIIVYAGKAHPQLAGADLVATYAANSLDFSELVKDSTLYYPRFVQLGF